MLIWAYTSNTSVSICMCCILVGEHQTKHITRTVYQLYCKSFDHHSATILGAILYGFWPPLWPLYWHNHNFVNISKCSNHICLKKHKNKSRQRKYMMISGKYRTARVRLTEVHIQLLHPLFIAYTVHTTRYSNFFLFFGIYIVCAYIYKEWKLCFVKWIWSWMFNC